MQQPQRKTKNPNFSSGPCSKYSNYQLPSAESKVLGRSHRSKLGKSRIKLAFDLSREILQLPDDYQIGMLAGSDTGAFECAMWSLLGPRKVDAFAWESFGNGWVTDITKQLKLDANVYTAPYGEVPDFQKADPNNDIVFLWNGTTAGARVPNGDWITDDRKGLTLCDATSAAFAMEIPWKKIDALTYSWQKCLGGEGAHGIIILSPRAVERIESYDPEWPMPKIFRLKKKGKLNPGIFRDSPINTPSMLCVEEYINALEWAKKLGGYKGLMEKSLANLNAVEQWVDRTPAFDFLTKDKNIRSNTSVCLSITDPEFSKLDEEKQKEVFTSIVNLLDKEEVAFDIKGYRDAPLGFRFWCGPTVEAADVEIALEWLAYAYQSSM